MGWGSLRVSDPQIDFLPRGLIIRMYGSEIAECVSDEVLAYNHFMEACAKLCKFYDKVRSLPGGKIQLFTQVHHLIDVVRKFRSDSRKWTYENKVHAVREALDLEPTTLTDARKVAKIIKLMLAEGKTLSQRKIKFHLLH